MAAERWLIADSIWWGRHNWYGRSALRLVGGAPTGEGPVSYDDIPADKADRIAGTLLPGLRDAHVHSALVDLRQVRAGGIAYVHDLGGAPADVAALRRRAADPAAGLPAMRIAGAFLTAPGGYPSDRSWAVPGSWRAVRSGGDAAAAVDEQITAGASFIKIALNTQAGPLLPRATLNRLVDAAHGARLPVVVHAEGPGTVQMVCDSGADRLAHTPWTESLDEGLLRAAAQQMVWISTLDIHGWGQPTAELDTGLDNARRFLAAGGTIWYGTDLGNGPLPAGVNPREIKHLQALGLEPDDILAAMTELTPLAPGIPPSWVPGGLSKDPTTFADALATAQAIS